MSDERLERYHKAQDRRDAAQRREFKGALDAAEGDLIQPTPDEARNGWTPESLTAYVTEQKAAQELRADPHSQFRRQGRRPHRAKSKYNPHRWRG